MMDVGGESEEVSLSEVDLHALKRRFLLLTIFIRDDVLRLNGVCRNL